MIQSRSRLEEHDATITASSLWIAMVADFSKLLLEIVVISHSH